MPSSDYQFINGKTIRTLISNAHTQRIRIALRLLSIGLRPCEVLRLDVRDVLLDNDPPQIFVRKPKGYKKQPYRWCKKCKERYPVEYIAHEHETVIKNNPAKPRKIPIEDPVMVDDLRIFIEGRSSDEPLLLTTRKPIKRLSYRTLQDDFKEVAEAIKKPNLVMYDLRHFKGKQLKKRGIPDSVGASYMGHTVEVYAHTYGQLDVGDMDDVLRHFPTYE